MSALIKNQLASHGTERHAQKLIFLICMQDYIEFEIHLIECPCHTLIQSESPLQFRLTQSPQSSPLVMPSRAAQAFDPNKIPSWQSATDEFLQLNLA